MTTTNITNFRQNIFEMLENTIKYNDLLNVTTKFGNAVVLSEDEYRGLIETLSILSNPEMKDKIIDGKNTPLDDCVPESEVEW
ncbi:MAG TPA: type II toxin-antitoxin system Phd/YefM family antitoxin [Candidatus Megamonas gallistercoris]|nr:type II toxin-antitoxin system Phd/YefM family antitoxin [Candidatus Megamonas gallistercoris]